MPSTIRVGLIGAGQNTRSRHLPGFRDIPHVEVVCVANRSLDSGQKVAAEFGIARVHRHWCEVVHDAEVDAVCIGTWPYLHAAITCEALEAGKHVLCEARMAANVAEARRMSAAADASDCVAMLVPSPLGLKGDRLMREMIGGGYLGEPRELYVRALNDAAMDRAAPLHWRHRSDLSGINVLTLGILNETVQRWFGRTKDVMATEAVFVPRRTDRETGVAQDADVPDSLTATGRMAIGCQFLYHISGHARLAGPTKIEAYGNEGTLVYDLGHDEIHAARRGDSALKPVGIPSEKACHWQVEQDFIASVRGEQPVRLTSFADGLKYMGFTEAVRRSAASGRRIDISEI